MSSSIENPEQFLETPSNMKSINIDQCDNSNTDRVMLEKTSTCWDDVCYAKTVNNSINRIDIQRKDIVQKEYCTSTFFHYIH